MTGTAAQTVAQSDAPVRELTGLIEDPATLRAAAESHGVCVRPILQELVDTLTGVHVDGCPAVRVHPGQRVPAVCGQGTPAADAAMPGRLAPRRR